MVIFAFVPVWVIVILVLLMIALAIFKNFLISEGIFWGILLGVNLGAGPAGHAWLGWLVGILVILLVTSLRFVEPTYWVLSVIMSILWAFVIGMLVVSLGAGWIWACVVGLIAGLAIFGLHAIQGDF